MNTTPAGQAQQAFAAHLRDPRRVPSPPGLESRRVAVYRDLFFNNIDSLLRTFFPVLHRLHAAEAWASLVRDFLAEHRCETPYFLAIAEEFIAWLDVRGMYPGDLPYARELAYYEWLELALDVAEETFPAGDDIDAAGDLLAGVPVLSPLAVLTVSHWPLHRLGAEPPPAAPAATPYFLLVYRDREDTVRFMELNAPAARLFTLLREQPLLDGATLAAQYAADTGQDDVAAVQAGIAQLLAHWRTRDIIAGTRRP